MTVELKKPVTREVVITGLRKQTWMITLSPDRLSVRLKHQHQEYSAPLREIIGLLLMQGTPTKETKSKC